MQFVGGAADRISIPLTTASTSTITGALTVAGGVGIAGAVNVSGTGIVYNGSTSGSTILKAAAAAGSTTITMPASSGTLALTSDIITAKKQEFTATAAQTTFTITNGYAVGSVQVFANGIALAAADYTATNGTTVVLTEARVAGDNIIVSSGGAFQAGGGGTTTNALTFSTGLSLNSGTTFDGSAAKTVSLATSGASAGTYGNNYVGGSYIYLPQITVDAYGRITSVSANYVSVGGGTTLPSQTGNAGKYLTTDGTTLSWATVATAGGSPGWYSMISTTSGITSLSVPTAYDGTNTNMAYVKLFVGGEDSSYNTGSQPSNGMWSMYSNSGTFNTYTNTDSSPGLSGSTISINSGSGGVRFAIAPKYVSPSSGQIQSSTPSSYSGSSFNSMNGWSGPPSYYSNKAWFGIVVVDFSSVTATAVNCTVHETKSSSGKTYFAISMTDTQCATAASGSNVCTFNTSVTMRSFSYYTYG